MTVDLDALNNRVGGGLPGLLGIRYVEASLDRLVAELEIREELRTGGSRAHGGTLMAFADTVGAVATVINLQPGTWTTTLESKTNFISAGNGVLRAEATPLHKGRRTQVWQTRVTDASGRLVSVTTQTQIVLEGPRPTGSPTPEPQPS
jgi:1,4-dihydroxy-2-naphthoyl-CoA hydrolase